MYFSYIQNTGASILIVASKCGQTEVAGVLISRDAAVDYQDKVRQYCMIRVITVVLRNGMIIGI